MCLVIGLTLLGTVTPPSRAQNAPILPAPLYYIAGDQHIHRLETDNLTVSVITPGEEQEPVTAFDVSPVDGAVAYVTANKLFVADRLGENAAMIFDGGTLALTQGYVDVADMLTREVTKPMWSPDGTQIAFGYGGINVIPAAGGVAILALPNGAPDPNAPPEMPVGARIYRPHAWSPDGARLLVEFNFVPEGGGYAVLPLGAGAVTDFIDPATGFFVSCCEATWTPDSAAVYVSSPAQGLVEAGLWRVDSSTGEAANLIKGVPDGSTTVNLVGFAQVLTDGNLYYFAGQTTLDMGTGLMSMVRARPDGVSELTPLRTDTYEISEARWHPAATGAVIADQTAFDYANAQPPFFFPLRWLSVDGAQALSLPEAGRGLRWGTR
jgi:hypothetical protein